MFKSQLLFLFILIALLISLLLNVRYYFYLIINATTINKNSIYIPSFEDTDDTDRNRKGE